MPDAVSQTYANHRQYVFSHHIATFFPMVLCLIWTVTRLVQHPSIDTAFMVVLVLVVASVWYHARVFALKAQSRLIRLEERLRLARLLPADLQSRVDDLRPGQLVGLRFAADAEVVELVRKVLAGSLTTADEIKRAVRSWRPDTYRV
ncbi:MAG: DUF6526 family protein [Gemmatimonadota bacterium]